MPPISTSTSNAVHDLVVHDKIVQPRANCIAPNDNNAVVANRAPKTNHAISLSDGLRRELLAALHLGTRNFVLAYHGRAAIALLMRVITLLRKRNVTGVFDLKQLLDEKHLKFRVDAASLGLFIGWFTGGYRALRALLPHLLAWLALQRKKQVNKSLSDSEKSVIDQFSTFVAGAVAATAAGFLDAQRRKSLALYALARACQCLYNTAKHKGYWHFWGSHWNHGDSLLYAITASQVMYAYVMRPESLPSSYFRFVQKTGPFEMEAIDMVQRSNRGLPLDPAVVQDFIAKHNIKVNFPLPSANPDVISCRLIHHHGETCTQGFLQTFAKAFKLTYPLYLSLCIVPTVLFRTKKVITNPISTLGSALFNATRSNSFVAGFTALLMASICLQRRIMTTDHKFTYWAAGLGASLAILIEPKHRRTELALYVLPRALDSLFFIMRDRGMIKGIRNGEILVFALSMGCMMHAYEHERGSLAGFVRRAFQRALPEPKSKQSTKTEKATAA